MKYLAAYLLLIEGGNTSPSASDVSALLETVGAEVDQGRVSALLKDLEGKQVADLIAEGQTKLASVPTGGAASAGGASAAASGDAGAAAAEEEKEEEKEESDEDMGMGLFD
ncbi:DEHA2G13486p [Debaryomyces hansenii CBS767]|jgi:large subunit ribosomal protein LP2|uniref:DEHA2G13486p n=1 Tax=Debaryomyces hansenii (strain ATCC 36239 / CBS 767 / BCRC 21394 / JCM 1990 / NBRC 0083 / IGC 2968) TaxID=284592 RepID=Q6BI47_DEBHA|nr:60S acidic ribosomal protein P2 [Debaryomyces hansenii CBS767]CAG90610.1 DEHA2G13486p [Debaryomyces hansenii CBS767]|eukprot:XP_462124.1 60S acidic ribosomal protein P2 [Debaryomyces hansenii CBS767]